MWVSAAPTSAQRIDAPTVTGAFVFGTLYPANQWIPMRLLLNNPTGRTIEGYVSIQSGGRNGTELRTRVTVPAHSRVVQRTFAYFPPYQDVNNPLTTLMWYDSGGGVVAREPFLGKSLGDTGAATSKVILITDQRSFSVGDHQEVDAMEVGERLSKVVSYPLGNASANTDTLPGDALGYQSALAVILDEVDLERLDDAQRDALLGYVQSGGMLVLSAPGGSSDPRGTWLEPYLPVQIIGHRQASELPLDGGSTIQLAGWLPMTEATPIVSNDNTVVLSGGGFVHVAYKSLGMGRIIFTSFPVGAIRPASETDTTGFDPVAIWEQLLAVHQPGVDWRQSELANQQVPLLGRMIGKSAPPWNLAVGIVAGYLVLALVAQLAWRGTSRPTAFMVGTVVALLVTGGLFCTRLVLSGQQPLMLARIATLDLAPTGGGVFQEASAYVGVNDPQMSLSVTEPGTSIRPLLGEQVTIELPSFTVPGAGVMSDRIDRIWQVESTLDRSIQLNARGRFGPEGLILEMDNATGGVVQAPVLVNKLRAISLSDLQIGPNRTVAGEPNPRGSFINATVFTSETAKLRGEMIRAMLTRPRGSALGQAEDQPLRLIGWLGEDHALNRVKTSLERQPVDHQLMAVSCNVTLEPPAAGSSVRVGHGFVTLEKVGPSPLYDFTLEEWIETRLPAMLDLSFAPPAGTQGVAFEQATIALNIDAPGYTVTLRRQRSSGDDALARLNSPVGPQSAINIPLTRDDLDSQGRIVVRLDVQPISATGAGDIASPWLIKSLTMSLQGQSK